MIYIGLVLYAHLCRRGAASTTILLTYAPSIACSPRAAFTSPRMHAQECYDDFVKECTREHGCTYRGTPPSHLSEPPTPPVKVPGPHHTRLPSSPRPSPSSLPPLITRASPHHCLPSSHMTPLHHTCLLSPHVPPLTARASSNRACLPS